MNDEEMCLARTELAEWLASSILQHPSPLASKSLGKFKANLVQYESQKYEQVDEN